MLRSAGCRFCLMVKKGYRDPPYHNWMHAFSVSHFCYLLYKNLELTNYLEDIEIFALFISCMCHDLDHRGTNNSFQVASKSVLAALYSSEGSVMEVLTPRPHPGQPPAPKLEMGSAPATLSSALDGLVWVCPPHLGGLPGAGGRSETPLGPLHLAWSWGFQSHLASPPTPCKGCPGHTPQRHGTVSWDAWWQHRLCPLSL